MTTLIARSKFCATVAVLLLQSWICANSEKRGPVEQQAERARFCSSGSDSENPAPVA